MIISRIWTLILLSIILTGCSKDANSIDPQGNILAIINGDTLSVGDFKSYLAPDGKPSSEIVSFQRLIAKLNELVQARIIVAYGYDNKLNDNPEIILQLRTKRDEFFYQKFLKDYIYSPLVREDEMIAYYEKLKTEVRVQQILIKYVRQQEITVIDKSKLTRFRPAAKALADSLYTELIKQPNAFSILAEKFSDDEISKILTGDIGYLRFGETDQLFEEVVFSLKDGEICKPLETEKGFHILKIAEHRQVNNLKTYEEAKQGVLDMLIASVIRNNGNLIKLRMAAVSDSILNEHEFRANSTNINLFLRRYQSIQKPSEIVSVFKNDELVVPLASYENGQIQVLELALVMKNNNSKVKMNDALVQFGLRSVASKRIISEWIQGKGYTLSPGEKLFLQNIEQTMMQNMALNFLNEKVSVSEEDINKFYDNNKEQYREPGLLDVEEIRSENLATLNNLADEVRRGVHFDSIFHKAEGMQGIKTNRTGLVPDNTKDMIVMNATKLQPGENSEPFQNALGGYSMIKLLEKKEGKDRPLETIKKRVVLDCLNFKRQMTYNEWIANLSAQYKVQVFPDRLKSAFDIKLK